MCDTIELTTWPKHQNKFYKTMSGSLTFYIKGEKNAAVGLAKEPGQHCEYWVIINYYGQTQISRNNEQACAMTPDILSPDEYRKFWINWSCGRLKFGRACDTTPLVSLEHNMPDLAYVTFTALDSPSVVKWKINLPPVIETLSLKRIKGGEMYWVPLTDKLPDDALIGGFENETLYIMRAMHEEALTPGKLVPSRMRGYVAWDYLAHEKEEFEILCGYDCTWVVSHSDQIPVGAIEGGYTETGHDILYVGRVLHEGHIIPGKIEPAHKVCYYPYNGRTFAKSDYEILVAPFSQKAAQSANDYLIIGEFDI